MEIKGTNIYLQLSELPTITEVLSGDSFIVQTSLYPSVIKFYNIIIDPNNTTFYSNITNNQTNIYTISGDNINLSSYIIDQEYITSTKYSTYETDVIAATQTSINTSSNKIDDGFVYLTNDFNSRTTNITSFETAPKAWVIFDSNAAILEATPGIDNVTRDGEYGTFKITFEEFLIDYFYENSNPGEDYGGYCVIATIGGTTTCYVYVQQAANNTEVLITPIYKESPTSFKHYINFDYISVSFYSL